MKLNTLGIGLMVMAQFALTACMSTGVQPPNNAPIAINPSIDSMVILGKRHFVSTQTEVDYIECIGEHLADRAAPMNIIPEQHFVDNLYPYFEKSTAPLSVSSISNMVKNPTIAKKFKDLNLRYLVWVDGNTQITNSNGGLSCAIGPGGGGCLGFAKWDDEAEYTASVWDLDSLSLSGNVNTVRSGTSYLPAVIIPIPILSGVQDTACNDMARRIHQYIQ